MKKVISLLQSILIILIYPVSVFAEDFTSIREEKKHSIKLDLGVFSLNNSNRFFNDTTLPIVGVNYSYNINKNFSVGTEIKSAIFFNSLGLFGRYYFDYLNNRNGSFYFDLILNSFITISPVKRGKGYTGILFYPTIGYEFIADNGLTISISTGFGYGNTQNINFSSINFNTCIGLSSIK